MTLKLSFKTQGNHIQIYHLSLHVKQIFITYTLYINLRMKIKEKKIMIY